MTPGERFWVKVDRSQLSPGGCWPWLSEKSAAGYGRFWVVGGRRPMAHRFAFATCRGDIPAGLVVRHRCNNPSCVNPDHLAVGTTQDNIDDRQRAGNTRHGETHVRAKLSEAQAIDALRRRACGETGIAIAREYGVQPAAISKLVVGRNWKHLPRPAMPLRAVRS